MHLFVLIVILFKTVLKKKRKTKTIRNHQNCERVVVFYSITQHSRSVVLLLYCSYMPTTWCSDTGQKLFSNAMSNDKESYQRERLFATRLHLPESKNKLPAFLVEGIWDMPNET